MRGHGRSGKPESMESYSPQLYANDFMIVSRAFDLNKPTYVGWLVSHYLLRLAFS